MPSAQRFFIIDRGANDFILYDEIIKSISDKTDYIYFNGYSLQNNPSKNTLIKFISEMSENNKIIFNTSSPNIVSDNVEVFKSVIMNYVDV